jgi:NAD(P)-dependent dehydrogenase (short-subunit alcohol dehydrogenase family)
MSQRETSPLEGAPIIVTGGSCGLGAAVVNALAARGAKCVVLDRRPPSEGIDYELVDLADGRAAEATVHRVVERVGRLGAVITCAGIDACGRLEDVDGHAWERVVAVNLFGTVAVVRAALPALRRARGRIVTVASTLGLRPVSDATAYCASKFGVVGFTRALATELAGDIGVTLIVPGGMATGFFDGRPEQYQPSRDAKLNAPERVAETIRFALEQPAGTEVRELVVCPSTEPSWP